MNNDKSKALVPVGTSSWQELREIATVFHKSGMVPKSFRTAEQVISACVVARDLGLPPSSVLQGKLYIVNGIVSVDSQTMMALILSSGQVKVKIEKDDDKGWVEVTMERPVTGLSYTAKWDEARVQKSRVNLDPKNQQEKWPWKLHRQTMKTWRAIGEAARIVAPDLIGGVYLPDEVNMPTRVINGEIVVDVEAQDITPSEGVVSSNDSQSAEAEECQVPRHMNEFYPMAKRLHGISKNDAVNKLTVILKEEIGPEVTIQGAIDEGITVEELWEKLIAALQPKDAAAIWGNFLKSAGITGEKALELLNAKSVNEWTKQAEGRNLDAAMQEIRANLDWQTFLQEYNITEERAEKVLGESLKDWLALNPTKTAQDAVSEIVALEGLDK